MAIETIATTKRGTSVRRTRRNNSAAGSAVGALKFKQTYPCGFPLRNRLRPVVVTFSGIRKVSLQQQLDHPGSKSDYQLRG